MKFKLWHLFTVVAFLAVALAIMANRPIIRQDGFYRALESRNGDGIGYYHLLDFHGQRFYYDDRLVESAEEHYCHMRNFPLLVDRGAYRKHWSRITFETDFGNVLWEGRVRGSRLILTARKQNTGGTKTLEFEFCHYVGVENQKQRFQEIME